MFFFSLAIFVSCIDRILAHPVTFILSRFSLVTIVLLVLQSQIQDPKFAKEEASIINIPRFNIAVVREFVEYGYVRQVSTNMVHKYPLETLALAKRFHVTSLENAIQTMKPMIVTYASVVDLFVKSSKACYHDNPFQFVCLDFIVDKFHCLDHEEIVKRIPKTLLSVLLQRLHPFPTKV